MRARLVVSQAMYKRAIFLFGTELICRNQDEPRARETPKSVALVLDVDSYRA